MRERGEIENTTETVEGVEGDGDDYVVIDDDKLDEIALAGTSASMAVEAIIDLGDVPREAR